MRARAALDRIGDVLPGGGRRQLPAAAPRTSAPRRPARRQVLRQRTVLPSARVTTTSRSAAAASSTMRLASRSASGSSQIEEAFRLPEPPARARSSSYGRDVASRSEARARLARRVQESSRRLVGQCRSSTSTIAGVSTPDARRRRRMRRRARLAPLRVRLRSTLLVECQPEDRAASPRRRATLSCGSLSGCRTSLSTSPHRPVRPRAVRQTAPVRRRGRGPGRRATAKSSRTSRVFRRPRVAEDRREVRRSSSTDRCRAPNSNAPRAGARPYVAREHLARLRSRSSCRDVDRVAGELNELPTRPSPTTTPPCSPRFGAAASRRTSRSAGAARERSVEAALAWSSCAAGAPKTAMTASPATFRRCRPPPRSHQPSVVEALEHGARPLRILLAQPCRVDESPRTAPSPASAPRLDSGVCGGGSPRSRPARSARAARARPVRRAAKSSIRKRLRPRHDIVRDVRRDHPGRAGPELLRLVADAERQQPRSASRLLVHVVVLGTTESGSELDRSECRLHAFTARPDDAVPDAGAARSRSDD